LRRTVSDVAAKGELSLTVYRSTIDGAETPEGETGRRSVLFRVSEKVGEDEMSSKDIRPEANRGLGQEPSSSK
jgi:hypothetical protein